MMSEQRYLAIELAATVEWERAKGQLRALIELLGAVPSEYEKTAPFAGIRGRHWEMLQTEVESLIEKVEANEWHLPDRP